MQKVMKSVQDTEPSVRWEAVVFLDKIKSPQAMPVMEEMLHHDMEPSLKIKIVDLLGDRRGPDVLRCLLIAMKDQEADVRVAALKSLDKIGDISVASDIANGPIHDQEESVRLQAMKTLNSLQDKRQREIDEARAKYEAEKAAALAAQQKK
jgi:HEAT repeat protein